MRTDEIKTHNITTVVSKDSHKDMYEIQQILKFVLIIHEVA
jgi:hypothetical protein